MKSLLAVAVVALFGSVVIAQIDRAETERVIKRFQEPRNVSSMEGASWALAHQYGDINRVGEVFKFAQAYFGAFKRFEAGDTIALEKLGGVKAFKTKLSGMLKDPDPAVRCYSATLIGITGDKTMAPQLAGFLQSRTGKRGASYCEAERAMEALGVMGAVEYKAKIASYLGSDDTNERNGAITALASLGAKEYADRIAPIMLEPINTHDTSPILFLIETGTAQDYKPLLVKTMLNKLGGYRSESAMYALASIDAKEHAKDIATFLDDEFKKGDAAIALALLGATEYATRIKQLLNDESPLVRCTALIALGVMNAREHTAAIAELLKDKESYVQPYAAAALILLRAEAHYKDALPHLENREALSEYLLGRQFPREVEQKGDAVKKRALDTLDEANKAAKLPGN